MEGNVCVMKEPLAKTDLGNHLGSTQVDSPERLQPRHIDHCERIVQRVGHKGRLAVRRNCHATGAVAGGDVLDDELGRFAQVVREDVPTVVVGGCLEHRD